MPAKSKTRDGNERSGGKAIVVAVVAILGLPILYVLSIGPAAWLSVHDYIDGPAEDALEAMYVPLGLLAEQSNVVRDVLMAYISLWVDIG